MGPQGGVEPAVGASVIVKLFLPWMCCSAVELLRSEGSILDVGIVNHNLGVEVGAYFGYGLDGGVGRDDGLLVADHVIDDALIVGIVDAEGGEELFVGQSGLFLLLLGVIGGGFQGAANLLFCGVRKELR